MSGRRWVGVGLALLALAACGIKGDPAPPMPVPPGGWETTED